MDPLGTRTALIIALALALAMFGAALTLTKIADDSPRIHCSDHFPLSCAPTTGKAA